MTTLYHTDTTPPAPLPKFIRLSNGRIRTDPATFTADEIADSGLIETPSKPDYDPTTQRCVWDGAGWIVEGIPTPEPRYTPLDSAALIQLLETAGGMTPEQVVASNDDPSLKYFWLLLQVTPYTSRDNLKLPAALTGLEVAGYLPNGAQAVLDAWPTS
ncbi:hypothetical protein [Epibacterium ulvae]|uniref:hypothetical protein n=1 Tax=Epibacterium ulvae TaxID=1156985 RepID=UPI002492A303|nr:hypothetical protein [Epibacterium ulvae]